MKLTAPEVERFYGYLPLPLTSPKASTAGKDVPTGNHCWTLFLNTGNFKGPVTHRRHRSQRGQRSYLQRQRRVHLEDLSAQYPPGEKGAAGLEFVCHPRRPG